MFVLVGRTQTERQDLIYFICCPAMNPKHVTMVSSSDPPLDTTFL